MTLSIPRAGRDVAGPRTSAARGGTSCARSARWTTQLYRAIDAEPAPGSLLAVLRSARDEGEPRHPRRAARPGGDAARRRPRDDRRLARLGARAPRPPPATSWPACARGDEEYLEATVKEVLRVRPVLSIAARRVREPFEVGGHTAPAGRPRRAVHLPRPPPPEVRGRSPTAFRPERFLDATPAPYTYLPFGGGVRRCIGAAFATLEMKEVLRAVAQRFELAPARAAAASGCGAVPSPSCPPEAARSCRSRYNQSRRWPRSSVVTTA